MKKSNDIRIVHAANGWLVEMPRTYRDVPPAGEAAQYGNELMSAMKPMFKEIMRLRDTDPLLESLRGEPDAEEQDQQLQDAEPTENIGVDPHVYVFPTFQGVLDFLERTFL